MHYAAARHPLGQNAEIPWVRRAICTRKGERPGPPAGVDFLPRSTPLWTAGQIGVDGSLGHLVASLDPLSAANPLDRLSAWRAGWLEQQADPLRQAWTWLGGKPTEVAGHADGLTRAATAMGDGGTAGRHGRTWWTGRAGPRRVPEPGGEYR